MLPVPLACKLQSHYTNSMLILTQNSHTIRNFLPNTF